LLPGPFAGAVGVGPDDVLGAAALVFAAPPLDPLGDVSLGPFSPHNTTVRTKMPITAKIAQRLRRAARC